MIELSQQQKEAVEYMEGPALVVAGAGAGKTRTLTAKIAYLLEKGFNPRRILAITFTNKAADEMKTRLLDMTGLGAKNFFWVRTYHSTCYIILREHCELLGYAKPLQIFNIYQQQKIVDKILANLKIDKKYGRAVRAEISRAKNSSRPELYLDKISKKYPKNFINIYGFYEKTLKDQNAVDFDNILLMTRNILRDFPEIKERYQKQFQYILVDEYQDSNDIQEELTGLLIKDGNLFCVGDDWQAVYGFRGSNVKHFLDFAKKYNNAKIFKLEQNYRSANNIVQLANELIGCNEDRIEKKCFSKLKGGSLGSDTYDDDIEEAESIALRIAREHKSGKGTSYNQFAVIYRTRFCSLAFEKAFRAYGIPYSIVGGQGFFERKEIVDILSYLTASVFPKDDPSFLRIINTPKRGVGPALLKKIETVQKEEMSLQDAVRTALDQDIFTSKNKKAIANLIQLLDDIGDMHPQKAIKEVFARIDYKEHLKQYIKNTSMDLTEKIENIEQLIYSASEKEDMLEFLEEAALIREDKEDNQEGEESESVKLLTIHSAKGLEFDTVFIIGCEENLFPHWKSMDSDKELAEERRLMYVAITRAKQNLYLSCADYRKGDYNPKSRFLYEIGME